MWRIRSPRSTWGGSDWVTALLLLITLGVLAPLTDAQAAPGDQAIQLGAGGMIPFDAEHRGVYGTAPAFSLGFTSRVSSGDTWVVCEIGYLRSSGQEFSNDPAFEIDDSEYWLVPISLGVRTSGSRLDETGLVRLYFGVAGQWILTGWDDPFEGSHNSPTVGISFELRPEFRVNETWRLWLRQRFALLSNIDYGNGIRRINYSGSTLDLGANYHF